MSVRITIREQRYDKGRRYDVYCKSKSVKNAKPEKLMKHIEKLLIKEYGKLYNKLVCKYCDHSITKEKNANWKHKDKNPKPKSKTTTRYCRKCNCRDPRPN